MEERRRDVFLWMNLILTALSAAWIYYLLAQCQEAVAGERVLLSEETGFDNRDPGQFQDLIHLSSQGREDYTRRLCRQLRDGADAERE